MATTPDSPAYVGFEGMTLHRVIGPVPHDDVEAAIAATRLVESDDALAANRCENGLVGPDWPQVLGQFIGTCGKTKSAEKDESGHCRWRLRDQL